MRDPSSAMTGSATPYQLFEWLQPHRMPIIVLLGAVVEWFHLNGTVLIGLPLSFYSVNSFRFVMQHSQHS